MNFDTMAKSHAEALKARLTQTRAILQHAGQKGTAAETALRDLLRQTLPERLGIAEGVVGASDGTLSAQQDLIIYDAADAPVFFRSGETKVIPIEYVYAIIEVKTRLTAGDIEATSKKNALIRSKQKFFVGDSEPKSIRPGGWTYHQAGKRWFSPPINAFLFAYECDAVDAVWERYKSIHRADSPYAEWLDAVCISGDTLMTRTGTHGVGDTIGTPEHLVLIRENALLGFIAQLWMHSSEWRMREVPALFRYVKRYSFVSEQAVQFTAIASHPDCMD